MISSNGTFEGREPELGVPEVASYAKLVTEAVAGVFVGSAEVIRLLTVGVFGGLHVLVEDVPGVGKTTLARSLASACGLDFGRIQFTPDLLPGDVTGSMVWDTESHRFHLRAGAIAHQFVLADELNRASTRTQAALLEAMQEGAVTIDGTRHPLPDPFVVVATQNPAEFAGTFPLPESELDRFALMVSIGYPSHEEELRIVGDLDARIDQRLPDPVLDAATLRWIRTAVRSVHVSDGVRSFAIRVAEATRTHERVHLGMSPRATVLLLHSARTLAAVEGRDFVIPEDVIDLLPSVAVHRLVLTGEAEARAIGRRELIREIIDRTEKPPHG